MRALSLDGTPGHWRGPELFDRTDWGRQLVAADLDPLEAVATRADPERWADQGSEAFPLPTLGPLISALQTELEHGAGAVLLRGLPVARWGEEISTRAFWAMANHLGTPLSQSASGERVFHVRDHGYAPDDPRYRGPASRARLSFHTDRCDVIAFCCLRAAETGGENYVVSSVALYEALRREQPGVLEVLCEPFPYVRHTVDHGNALPFCELPVFSERDGQFGAHFLRVLIDRADRAPEAPSLTARQREALDALETLAEDPALHVRFRLGAGDILLLNNWITFHRRSAFTDQGAPETRRHLLRIWLSMANSRPIADCFVDHFGATAAGVLRGGMKPRVG